MPENSINSSGPTEPGDRSDVVRAAALREAPKHRRLLRTPRDGRVLNVIMRRLFVLSVPVGHAVLTTIGRKSGRPRSTFVRAIRRQDKVYVVMLRPPALAVKRPSFVSAWVHNIRASPKVRVRLGRREIAGLAREIGDPVELEQARDALCGTVHLIDYGECSLHLRGLPTRNRIRDLHRYWFETGIPLVIDLAPQASARLE